MKHLLRIFTIGCLFYSGHILAEQDSQVKFTQKISIMLSRCSDEFDQWAKINGSKNKWIKQLSSEPGGLVYRTPTSKFGSWIEVKVDKGSHIVAAVISNELITKYNFGPGCNIQSEKESGFSLKEMFVDKSSRWLSDQELLAKMKKAKRGIVYLWSPDMMYSAMYYKYFREIAKKLKIEFIPILDPNCSLRDVAAVSKKYGIEPNFTKLNSVELYMRGATTHFPSTVVFDHQKLKLSPIVGVMEKDEIQKEIENRFLTIE